MAQISLFALYGLFLNSSGLMYKGEPMHVCARSVGPLSTFEMPRSPSTTCPPVRKQLEVFRSRWRIGAGELECMKCSASASWTKLYLISDSVRRFSFDCCWSLIIDERSPPEHHIMTMQRSMLARSTKLSMYPTIPGCSSSDSSRISFWYASISLAVTFWIGRRFITN
jgi:hypothetical protein